MNTERSNSNANSLGLRSRVILVVEDEEEVRKVLCLTLELKGFRVLGAATAEAALTIAKANVDPIDLLLTDVVLPESSGPELAQKIRTLQGNVQVLFISGYSEDLIQAHGLVPNEAAFLAKPFSSTVLCQKIRELLQ